VAARYLSGYQYSEKALVASVAELHVKGVSIREVKAMAEAVARTVTAWGQHSTTSKTVESQNEIASFPPLTPQNPAISNPLSPKIASPSTA
jgi:transposase-like protein